MDAHRFDILTRSVLTSSRRGTLRLLVGSVLAGLLPLGTEAAEAKKRGTGKNRKKRSLGAEACIPTGKRCPSPKPRGRKGKGKGRRPKQLSCEQCCQGHVATGPDGKRHCACQPDTQPCHETRECCSGSCTGGVCGVPGPTGCAACTSTQLCEGGGCQTCDVCPSGCRFTSVHAALDAASAGATIRICPGTYIGTLLITQNVTLIGAGDGADPATNTILQGTGTETVVGILRGTTVVTLQGLRITGGMSRGGEEGGDIYNAGATLTLIDSTITGNTASVGGGIFNGSGTVRIDAASRVTGNTARDGGGIYYFEGTVILASDQVVTNNCPDNCDGTTPVANCAVAPVSCP